MDAIADRPGSRNAVGSIFGILYLIDINFATISA